MAGVSAAQTLRLEGFDGRLFLIGEEEHEPYDRTALSKAVLAGETAEPPPLMTSEQLEALDVESITGRTVVGVDSAAGTLRFADGGTLASDRLLLVTGARARVPRVPGVALSGVHTLRTSGDVKALRQAWRPAPTW